MAEYGLGNFLYTLDVVDGKANFKFRDPEDASNTAEVSVSQSDFPDGVTQADARQVADVAYAQCSKVLNDKRDARVRKQAAKDLEAKHEEDARVRESAADFLNNAQDAAVQPVKTEDDGTNVFNTASSEENASANNTDNNKKK